MEGEREREREIERQTHRVREREGERERVYHTNQPTHFPPGCNQPTHCLPPLPLTHPDPPPGGGPRAQHHPHTPTAHHIPSKCHKKAVIVSGR
jgi:hypothetical protein